MIRRVLVKKKRTGGERRLGQKKSLGTSVGMKKILAHTKNVGNEKSLIQKELR